MTAHGCEPSDLLVVAFSGGPDSTALLRGLSLLGPARPRLLAAHVDHRMDRGSSARADAARRLAEQLEAPFRRLEIDVPAARQPGESLEATARHARYRELEALRVQTGARWVLTAHHRDDQAETLLLRWLQGTGLAGLAGILPRLGSVLRPLLRLDKATLLASLDGTGLRPVDDPTNRSMNAARNRVRAALLPAFEAAEPGTSEGLARLADQARRAGRRIDAVLRSKAPPLPAEGDRPAGLDLEAFSTLPRELRSPALALLARQTGAPHGPGRAVVRELTRQLDSGARVRCDGGGGWIWFTDAGRLALRSVAEEPPPFRDFSYTSRGRETIELPALGLRARLVPSPVERVDPPPGRFSPPRSSDGASRALLGFTPPDRWSWEVRNRRPGDRIHLIGRSKARRLKEILIDRKVPRHERQRLPILVIDGRIAWIPGIGRDVAFAPAAGKLRWEATLDGLKRREAEQSGNPAEPNPVEGSGV